MAGSPLRGAGLAKPASFGTLEEALKAQAANLKSP
jgi:hypothetical protein